MLSAEDCVEQRLARNWDPWGGAGASLDAGARSARRAGGFGGAGDLRDRRAGRQHGAARRPRPGVRGRAVRRRSARLRGRCLERRRAVHPEPRPAGCKWQPGHRLADHQHGRPAARRSRPDHRRVREAGAARAGHLRRAADAGRARLVAVLLRRQRDRAARGCTPARTGCARPRPSFTLGPRPAAAGPDAAGRDDHAARLAHAGAARRVHVRRSRRHLRVQRRWRRRRGLHVAVLRRPASPTARTRWRSSRAT